MFAPAGTEPEERIKLARRWLFERGMARAGDRAVVLSCADSKAGTPDTLRVVRLEERR